MKTRQSHTIEYRVSKIVPQILRSRDKSHVLVRDSEALRRAEAEGHFFLSFIAVCTSCKLYERKPWHDTLEMSTFNHLFSTIRKSTRKTRAMVANYYYISLFLVCLLCDLRR